MTDRIKGFTVILDKEYRIDDAEVIQNAIKMIKGVVEVTPHVMGGEDYIAKGMAKHQFKMQMYDLLKNLE